MFLFTRGQQTAHRLGQSLCAARREVRQRLHAWQAAQRLGGFQPALTAYVKGRNRVDLIIPKLNTIGVGRLRWEHVQNTAAHRELPHALDLYTALIARARQLLGQRLERYSLSGGKGHHRALQRIGRQRALHRRLHRQRRE